MAVVNLIASQLQDDNQDARANTQAADGYLKSVQGLVSSNADDTQASTYRFARVPTNANIRSIKLTCAAASTAGAIDIGVAEVAYDGNTQAGTVIDADLFASAIDLSAGANTRTEVAFESGEYAIAERIQPLWQAAGETENPHGYFDIIGTVTTTFNGGPTAILVEVQYVV